MCAKHPICFLCIPPGTTTTGDTVFPKKHKNPGPTFKISAHLNTTNFHRTTTLTSPEIFLPTPVLFNGTSVCTGETRYQNEADSVKAKGMSSEVGHNHVITWKNCYGLQRGRSLLFRDGTTTVPSIFWGMLIHGQVNHCSRIATFSRYPHQFHVIKHRWWLKQITTYKVSWAGNSSNH